MVVHWSRYSFNPVSTKSSSNVFATQDIKGYYSTEVIEEAIRTDIQQSLANATKC